MKFLFQKTRNSIYLPRACASCGHFLWELRWICVTCEQKLEHWQKFRGKSHIPFPHFWLWTWDKESHSQLYPLLRSLKGGSPSFALRPWCEMLFLTACKTEASPLVDGALIIPAAPRRRGQADHAHALAKELSRVLKIPMESPLVRSHESIQKTLTKSQRRRLKFEVQSPFTKKNLQTKSIYFVDDVVTTGSTALAAWKALGRPQEFRVWSLIYRRNLRNEKRPAITQ